MNNLIPISVTSTSVDLEHIIDKKMKYHKLTLHQMFSLNKKPLIIRHSVVLIYNNAEQAICMTGLQSSTPLWSCDWDLALGNQLPLKMVSAVSHGHITIIATFPASFPQAGR